MAMHNEWPSGERHTRYMYICTYISYDGSMCGVEQVEMVVSLVNYWFMAGRRGEAGAK